MIADRGQLGPDDFDALADLFLTEQQAARRPLVDASADSPARTTHVESHGTPRRAESSVEVLVLGHIPTMAASWASQYARLRSESLGRPVAMLRLGDQRARVELFNAPFQAASPDVSSAVHAARLATSHLIVLPAPGTPAESGTLVERGSAVTLLTTPDEAGLVAAYAELKRLAPACEAGSSGGPKPLRIVAVGAGAAKAQPACRRLQDAASSFLHVDMEASVFIERLSGGVAPVMLFDGAWLGTLDELVQDLVAVDEAPVAPEVLTRAPDPMPIDEPVVETKPIASLPDPAASLADGAPGLDPFTEVISMNRTLPTPPAATAVHTRAAARAHSVPSPSFAATDSAGGYVRLLPGLVNIAARCPHAGDVEIAFDADGRLHAVAFAQPGMEAQAVQSLVAASGWAYANRQLLGAVASRAASEGPAVMHLFTVQPVACRGLLDSAIKVHAIAHVSAQMPAGGMVSMDLN